MKKIVFTLILLSIAGASLFALTGEDLTKFPSCMNENSWLLNIGIGFPDFNNYDYNATAIWPMRITVDKNIGIGDKKLPFFAGGVFGYSGYGRTGHWFYNNITLGGRFGYHFNWGVKNLDTYAVVTAGWIIYADTVTDKSYYFSSRSGVGFPLFGVNLGARYFINDLLGFWGEVGYTSFSYLDVGVSLKF